MEPIDRIDTPRRLAARSHVPPGLLVGRAHVPPSDEDGIGGPTPVLLRDGHVFDASVIAPTVSALFELPDLAAHLNHRALRRLGSLADALAESHHSLRRGDRLHLLSPIDLQVIKASGVTFVESLLERMVEAMAGGDAGLANDVRGRMQSAIGEGARRVTAGSPDALALLEELRSSGVSTTYLEVGLGTLAEIFTKAPVLGSVGSGELIGVRPDAAWTNPEPEVVLIVDSARRIVGACLGNDVNLRDIEGRSPLLLGVAKDNNASCAIGPWIRLFDERFDLGTLMASDVACEIIGHDGFTTAGVNRLASISREPAELVRQTYATHAYPDGLALFLGTMFVPTTPRQSAEAGFTHLVGDEVTISNEHLGSLCNWVETCDRTPPWTMGVGALMENLAQRGLLAGRRA